MVVLTNRSLERACLPLLAQAPAPDDLEPSRVLDKRLDLLVRHALPRPVHLVEQLAQNLSDELDVGFCLGLVELLEDHVARGVCLHVRQRAREREKTAAGWVRHKRAHSVEQQPEVGRLRTEAWSAKRSEDDE